MRTAIAGAVARGDTRRRPGRTLVDGLTLVEMMVVIFLLGLLFSMTVMVVGGLAPLYQVRSASRSIGSQVEELRALAIATGQSMGIRYTFRDDPHYYQLIHPAPPDYPDQPLESRELGGKTELPPGVRIRQIVFPSGRAVRPPGAVNVLFSTLGNTGSHVVTLEGQSKNGQPIILSAKYNAITGAVDFYDGEADFQNFED